jgi:mRNA deadenylase 3'-5' endonuclease subunit Ccr4
MPNDTIENSKLASVRIVSYNILSSELADPEYFTKCDPHNLEASKRLPKILDKLQKEIDAFRKDKHDNNDNNDDPQRQPVVFCLQEVSHQWATALHVFFAERGYHMITGLYGKSFNGYMGIATAYPVQEFETLKVDLVRLSEKKNGGWPRKPKDPEPGIIRKFIFDPIYKPVKAVYQYYNPRKKSEEDAWDVSRWRFNQFIAVRLKNRNMEHSIPFWIGNYHMPCAFRIPAVMNIHADLVGSRIQQLATTCAQQGKKEPYILAGDFNILPNSPHYSLLRTGSLDETDETYPVKKYEMVWKPTVQGMRSAYVEFNGKEPEFTNNAHNGALNAESFIGTLDYIFLSDEWSVKAVQELPKIDDLKGVYPDDTEPSDHVLIAATLEIDRME